MKQIMRIPLMGLALAVLAGCQRTPPTDTVALVDVTQSIERDGTLDEFKVVDDLVDRMQRGDSLTVIPITGNAMSETPGHILRFTAPTERQAYDYDLVTFREQAHQSIQAMQNAAFVSPSKHTDILGALDVAKQELEASPPRDMKQLIVMSDFVEDDGAYRFTVDKALADSAVAQKLAGRLQAEHAFDLRNIHVSLSAIQSKDLRSICPERQRALREFWKRYFGPISNAEIRITGS
jgi:hypothetical protein